MGSGAATTAIDSSGITIGTGADLTVGGATTTNGITNTGTITTDGLTTTTLNISGATTLDSLGVTNNATVGGTFGVTGATTMQSTLVVNGLATFNGGIAIAGPIAFTGGLDVGGPTKLQSTLDVTGQANFNGGARVSKQLTVARGTNVNMGGNRIKNVGAPVASTDAATKGYVDQSIDQMHDDVSRAFRKIDENSEGIAVAMSMSGLALPDNKAFAISANMGFYGDDQAVSAQAALRLNRSLALTGGTGLGLDLGKVGGRLGIMAAW